MKYFIIAILAFYSVVVWGQDTDTNKLDARGKKYGLWKQYEKGKLVCVGHFVSGLPQGEFKYYHPDGKLKSISIFENGTAKVKATIFHSNGQKAAEGIFLSQQKDGTWNYYDKTGTLISIENYKRGVLTGDYKTFSPTSGALLEERFYSNGKLHGDWKTYYDQDNICSIVPYIDGKRNGVAIDYYYGNKIASKGVYHNNLKEGEWEYYDAAEKLRRIVVYSDSKEQDRLMVFYIGSQPQRLKQSVIAYFQKNGTKVEITLTSGRKIMITDDFFTITIWADADNFCKISPSIIASYNAIVGYTNVENNGILVKLKPDIGFEVYSEGDEAKAVKMIFNTALPTQD